MIYYNIYYYYYYYYYYLLLFCTEWTLWRQSSNAVSLK